MKTTQAIAQGLAKKGLLLTATTALSLAAVTAFTHAPAHAFCIELPGLRLGCDGGTTPVTPPSAPKYSVTQKNPHTRSVVQRFGPVDKETAAQKQREFQRTHYAIFRYAGIGEQVHTRAFPSSYAAQNYLTSRGPCRDANAFGICVLDLQQVRPAIVELAQVN
ncbi:MAG: hypothetical protein AAF329_22795 [Cyanobacteria bacterium P01_A01_bin.17]